MHKTQWISKALIGGISVATFLSGLSSVANAKNSFAGHVYAATERATSPLTTYEACSEYSDVGRMARHAAESDAVLECENDFNADCVVEGRKFRVIVSREFVGYRACEVTVYVHGYKSN
jgi:hypothetical protein